MKQQVSPGLIAAVIAVVVVLLGYFAWRSAAGPGVSTQNPYKGNVPPGAGPPTSGGLRPGGPGGSVQPPGAGGYGGSGGPSGAPGGGYGGSGGPSGGGYGGSGGPR